MTTIEEAAPQEESATVAVAEVFGEYLANSLTAVLGFALSVVALANLVGIGIRTGESVQIVSCAIYGVSLVLLYGMSTLYHSIRTEPMRSVFRLGDHACIYILIAGTYTPYALTWLTGTLAWAFFWSVWGVAVSGVLFKLLFRYRYPNLSTVTYILMGWIGVVAAKPILEVSPVQGLVWTVAGGLIYTVGTLFYTFDDRPYFHAIWHVFVLAGSACHYFAVVHYVIPSA